MLVRILGAMVLGWYLGVQALAAHHLGPFVLVPSIERIYYQMFTNAIDDPDMDWSKVDIGTGSPYCAVKNYQCLQLINWWVNTNIQYEYDSVQYGGEYFAKPSETMKTMKGDCDDSATFKYVLLRMNGFTIDEVNYLGVDAYGTGHAPNHAVVGVKLNGVEFDMDINYQDPIALKDTPLVVYDRMDERWFKVEKQFWQIW
jgi:predicted transglutaminase-like cysteine proteinase